MNRIVILLILLIWFTSSVAQDPFSTGQWWKYSISKTGMYKITASEAGELQGLPVDQIRILTLKGGPLPQEIKTGEPPIITDIPIKLVEDGDGLFNNTDYIIFFAEGPDILRFDSAGIDYRYNPYSRENYVFLGSNGETGLRIQEREAYGVTGPAVTSYLDIQSYEMTLNNLLSSGRNWYGEKFGDTGSREFLFDFPNYIPGGEIHLTSNVMAQSFGTSIFEVFINDNKVGEQVMDPVPDFLNPPSNNPFLFAVKGRERTDTFNSTLQSAEVKVNLSFQRASTTVSDGYLDYLLLWAESRIRLESTGQTVLQGPQLIGENSFTVQIEAPGESRVWNITDLFQPAEINDVTITESLLQFNDIGRGNNRYVVFDESKIPAPELINQINSSNVLSGSADMVIVSPPEFMAAAKKLAAHRSSVDGIPSIAVETTTIYDIFGSGKADPTAIRNMARWYYNNSSLKYLLLMGKASFDYLDILPFRSNFVPTYQSRNSLDPLFTYASDDYFGFMEPGEGQWEEAAGGNHTLELGIGRLPVISPEEAMQVVDKIIEYGASEESEGSWRSRLLFVADDEDANLHHRQADRLAILSDTSARAYQNKRLFLGSFEQQTTGGGEVSPETTEALKREIERGALLLNYTGHGNVTSWAQEQIFTPVVIRSLRNKHRLPLFVTATCEFGRFDDPREISGAELLLKHRNGGGIGILSTCRPVFSSSNFNLNEAFYNVLFDDIFQETGRLGDLMRETKNNSVDLAIDSRKVGNRNFTLFGDPSMRLALPESDIEITSITQDGQPTDTLKAGGLVIAKGEISGNPGYNGILEVTLRDKPIESQTLAPPPYIYSEKLNTLYSGKVQIENGKFEIEFVVPQNFSNKTDLAQFYLYAYSRDSDPNASGFKTIPVSGTSSVPSADATGPNIEIFFGDSTNLSRNDVNDNTLVYVKLTDDSGINTSGFGVNNNLEAVIDGEQRIILNEYYQARIDTYRSGWVIFPLNDLTAGRHTLTFTAWDVFNNSNRETVEFTVADPGTLVVKSLRNAPNPFSRSSSIYFDHNRSGEDLDIRITIINRNGQVIKEITYSEPNSSGSIVIPANELDEVFENLSPGLYLYGVKVRSRQDGAADVKYQKMMLIN